MIKIVNKGSNVDLTGLHQYELWINFNKVAEFWHRREQGLGECLRRAAIAADKSRHEALIGYIAALESEGQELHGLDL